MYALEIGALFIGAFVELDFYRLFLVLALKIPTLDKPHDATATWAVH
jgi:hypothetical protein